MPEDICAGSRKMSERLRGCCISMEEEGICNAEKVYIGEIRKRSLLCVQLVANQVAERSEDIQVLRAYLCHNPKRNLPPPLQR